MWDVFFIVNLFTTLDNGQITRERAGADPGGGVLGVRTPPPFGGPPNFIKREKTSRACARKGRVLVLNSYLDPPLSEILYPPLKGIYLQRLSWADWVV